MSPDVDGWILRPMPDDSRIRPVDGARGIDPELAAGRPLARGLCGLVLLAGGVERVEGVEHVASREAGEAYSVSGNIAAAFAGC